MQTRTLISLFVLSTALTGCSIHESGSGKNKDVDIKTPIGSLAVRTSKVDVKEVGLSPYPGAVEVTERDNDNNKANVNLSFPGMGLKVVALKYHSDDAPDKVLAFYKNDLKKFGNVLQCTGTQVTVVNPMKHDDKESDELACGDDARKAGVSVRTDAGTELKAGSKNRQHIVHVQPDGTGAKFELVYVEANDKTRTM